MGDAKVMIFLSLMHLLPSVSSSFQNNEVILIEETKFDYSGPRGPDHWGDLLPQWISCKNGTKQSPIPIRKVVPSPHLGELQCDIIDGKATLQHARHKIEVQWKSSNAKLIINNKTYKFLQLHFHSPSEHTINGKRFPLEMHMVYQSKKGEISVVSILYEYGRDDYFVRQITHKLRYMDRHNMTEQEIVEVKIDTTQMGKKYYRYFGSLTTPPCTEGVTWTIMDQKKSVSKTQIQDMKKYLGGANARPLQNLNGRMVYSYNQEEMISQEAFSPSNNS